MSFCPAARQFFERRGAPTPPLPYDAEVEYLESTGTQWIDTGVSAREGLLVECAGYIMSWTSSGKLFGCDTGGREMRFYVSTGRVDKAQFYFGAAMSATYMSSVPIGQSSHVFALDSTAGAKVFRIDGNVMYTWNTSLGVSLSSIFLFSTAASSFTSVSRIYSFWVKDATTGQTLVDLVPVRFTNELGQSEGAMYDRVSGAPFRNAGTGAFTIGPDK